MSPGRCAYAKTQENKKALGALHLLPAILLTSLYVQQGRWRALSNVYNLLLLKRVLPRLERLCLLTREVRDNGFKLCQQRFRLEIRKNFIKERALRY